MKKISICLFVMLSIFMVAGCSNSGTHPITQWVYNSDSRDYTLKSKENREYSVITLNSSTNEFYWVFGNRNAEYKIYGTYSLDELNGDIHGLKLTWPEYSNDFDYLIDEKRYLKLSYVDGEFREDIGVKEQHTKRPVLIGSIIMLNGEKRTITHECRTQIQKENYYR